MTSPFLAGGEGKAWRPAGPSEPERYSHQDLARMQEVDLAVELAQAESALATTKRGITRAWLRLRISECRAELARR